jgi:3-oxoacyl-[acyl-carrier-protein] synthase-3
MKFKFNKKKITGILTVLPENEVLFDDEVSNYNFPVSKSMKLKQLMGFNKKRIVSEGTTSSDLCKFGIQYLLDNKLLDKDEIDAIILVTQTPDYILPPTSNLIQGYFNLKKDLLCLDINQGCAGYIIGLLQSFMLLDQESISKVILLNADALSRKVSKNDRNSNPLIGDAAAITIIEKSEEFSEIYLDIKMNGQGAFALNIPAGGARNPSSSETSILKTDDFGNIRNQEQLFMKGDEVFQFVQNEVPPLIEDVMKYAGSDISEIDYFMFHQPNKFMLNKLADKLKIPHSKMPSNIVEEFGNSSGASIPTAITHNLSKVLEKNTLKFCLSGFGIGLTWGAIIINIGNLKFNKIINYKNGNISH